MQFPRIVEEGEKGISYVRDKEDNLYKLVCPKCGWPLEFHQKTGRKSHRVWECTNPFCPYKEWKVGLKPWKPDFLQARMVSMAFVPREQLKGKVSYNRQEEVYTLEKVVGDG